MSETPQTTDLTRRDALKKTTYAAPLILTLPAVPSFAAAGSSSSKERDEREKEKEKEKKR